MKKKILLINSDISGAIQNYFADKNVEIVENTEDYDLAVYNNHTGDLPEKSINIHPSLLPSFNEENAEEKAFLAGVKVSGITIHSNNKIIAQYPVLIGIDTHIDEFKKDILEVKKRLVPPVIEAILEDRVFDFQDLFKNQCSHNGCTSCRGCH